MWPLKADRGLNRYRNYWEEDGALAMRDLFMNCNITVLENFVELDHRLDRLMRQTVSR